MPQILLVDDDDIIRGAYRSFFSARGFTVSEATDGVEALETAKGGKFDFILVDMLMPKMGGLDFLRSYASSKPPDTVVFVLTNSQVPAQSETEARALGASEYLRKSSLTPSQLLKIMQKHLKP